MTTVPTEAGSPKRRLGDLVFANTTRAAGVAILLALAGVAVFLTAQGLPALGAHAADLKGHSNFLTYVAPSAEGAAKALDASPLDDTRTEGDLAVKVDRTTTESGAYPLMLTSYLIACPTYSGDKADLVKAFLKYVVSTTGQQEAADNAGSAPLPEKLQQQAESIIDTISAK